MGGVRKKKFSSGQGTRYISRTQAMRYLQLSLNDFRKLCILKGVYPREPTNRKKAQKGASGIKTLYYRKDIQFLSHEPNIAKLRRYKVIYKKIAKARALREKDDEQRLRESFPMLKLDHIVKERYPTFIDAIRDLDDALTLLFLYSSFPQIKRIPYDVISLCRRLTVEFMNYVIAAKALRKVFISIKGYYYQAEIKGQPVTWIVPHQFSLDKSYFDEVDCQVMSDFVQFYWNMVGFVNFRLYHSLNLMYPPVFPGHSVVDTDKSLVDEEVYTSECIAALNVDLSRIPGTTVPEEEEDGLDEFPMVEDQEKLEEIKKEMEKVKKLKTLFKGLKFFINREVPREPFVFVIRCFGGQVSWDKTAFVGATYSESDETITHQIVDRPHKEKQYISRYYVQPQWVFDSVNARELLPVEKYFVGVILPPHLSPFHSENKLDQYIPPEEAALTNPEVAAKLAQGLTVSSSDEGEEEEEKEEEGSVDSDESFDGNEEVESDNEDGIVRKMDKAERERERKKKMMNVTSGQVTREDPYADKKQKREEYKLRVTMIKNKHRKLYHSMVKGRKKRATEAWLLRKKRARHDEAEKQKLKVQKKEEKISRNTQQSIQ